jgi:hypothetical protein
MSTPYRLAALAAALALALTSCSQPPRVEGQTREELDASLAALVAQPVGTTPEALNQAVSRLAQLSSASETDRGKLPDPYDLLPGLTGQEVVRLMAKYPSQEVVPASDPDFPNGVIATHMLNLYQLQEQILRDARQSALLAGRSVIDQFPIQDLQFIPPLSGAGIERDRATFRVTLLNNTRFDIYRPSFQVLVKDGAGQVLFERVFLQPDRDKEPTGPAQMRTLDLTCCELLRDIYNNGLMRALPPQATISVSLLQVEDNAGSPMLETVSFTEQDNARLLFLEACIDHLQPRLETWVPPEDGSECLSERALADWETTRRTAEAKAPRTAALH